MARHLVFLPRLEIQITPTERRTPGQVRVVDYTFFQIQVFFKSLYTPSLRVPFTSFSHIGIEVDDDTLAQIVVFSFKSLYLSTQCFPVPPFQHPYAILLLYDLTVEMVSSVFTLKLIPRRRIFYMSQPLSHPSIEVDFSHNVSTCRRFS